MLLLPAAIHLANLYRTGFVMALLSRSLSSRLIPLRGLQRLVHEFYLGLMIGISATLLDCARKTRFQGK